MVLGLCMFGFEGDEPSVFEETLKFNIDAKFDMCGYSLLTPYPGTINWFEMMRRKQIVSFDWDKYDQSHIVFKPAGLSAEQFYNGYLDTYDGFYTLPSMMQRFPWDGPATLQTGLSTTPSSAKAALSPVTLTSSSQGRRLNPSSRPCRR